MSAFALDEDHDIFISGGQLSRVSGIDEVVQKITNKYLHYLGEWWLNFESGTPWFQVVFFTPGSISEVESVLKKVITSTPSVTSLTAFDATLSPEREFDITFEADTDFGPTGEVVVSG